MKEATLVVYFTLNSDDDDEAIIAFREYVKTLVKLTEGFTVYHAVVDESQQLYVEDES